MSTLHSTKAFPINQFNYSILSEYHCAYLGISVSSPSTYAFDFPLEKCKDKTTPKFVLVLRKNLVNKFGHYKVTEVMRCYFKGKILI